MYPFIQNNLEFCGYYLKRYFRKTKDLQNIHFYVINSQPFEK